MKLFYIYFTDINKTPTYPYNTLSTVRLWRGVNYIPPFHTESYSIEFAIMYLCYLGMFTFQKITMPLCAPPPPSGNKNLISGDWLIDYMHYLKPLRSDHAPHCKTFKLSHNVN